MPSKLSRGAAMYVVAILFSSLAIFLQVLPLDTSIYFQKSLGLSSSEVVALTSLYFVSYAIMQVPGGVLFDKYGLKYVLPISIFITTIGCVLFWSSSTGFMLGLSRIITGVGCSVAYISGVYIAVKFLPAKWLPLLIGLVESISTSGSVIAAKPLDKFLDLHGWDVTANVVIGFCMVLLVMSLCCMIGFKNKKDPTKASIISVFKSSLQLLKNKTLVAIFIYSFSTWLIIMSFAGFWLKDYLIYVHNYSESVSLGLIQTYWTSFIISSLLLSLMVKNFKTSRIYVIALAFLGCVTYMIMAIPVIFSYAGTVTVVIFGGISATGIIIAFAIVPKLVNSAQSGAVIAMNNVFIVLGGYSGQLLFGYVLKNIDIANIATNYNFKLETHYYTALLIYPMFTIIALIAIIYALCGRGAAELNARDW